MIRTSIALCTYNGAAFLEEQLHSILSQTHIPDELILQDDGSQDNTLEIAHQLLANAPFSVRIICNQKRLGTADNFQHALGACTGDVIFPCDQDDIWFPTKIATCLEVFSHQACGFIFHDAELVGSQGQSLHARLWQIIGLNAMRLQEIECSPFAAILKHPFATGCCMAIRKASLDKALPIGKGWIHDEWISAILSGLGEKCIAINTPLIGYRQHNAQEIGTKATHILPQLKGALQASRQEYLTTLEKFTFLKERLTLTSKVNMEMIQAKCHHNDVRANLGQGQWRLEMGKILSEYRTGNYRKYSWGNHGELKDIWRVFLGWILQQ